MSDGGFFDFATPPDNEGWTSLPTGVDNSGGLEDVYVTPMQTLPGDTGGGFNIDQFGKALQYGVDAYGKIMAIQHGGSSQYMTGPGTGIAPAQPGDQYAQDPAAQPGDPGTGSTFMQKLTDFSTPVPYAVGLVAVFGVLVIAHAAGGRR